MEHDYQKVHNEFILPTLRRSIIHPMDTKQMQTLLNIIELRLADPTNNPPLEIMTFGSSVVEGFNSNFHNWWQSGSYNKRVPESASFAWPARLEAVLNDVVFRGQNVVRVTNHGAGGTCSSSGALALEYRLFVATAPIPDIIIHSYGHTDSRYHGDDADALRIMQDFVQGAKKVRCNRDGLPFVVLYDDYHGIPGNDNLHFYMRFYSDLLLRDLPMKWKSNIAAYQEMCNQSADARTKQPCSPLSWLVNKAGGIRLVPKDIQNSMSAMSMHSLQNWYVEGWPGGRGKPRPGWVAIAPNATFTITIKDADHQGIKTMSVIAMKSYGAKWENSRLQITVFDEGPLGQGPSSQIGRFEIEGSHNLTISVFFDHKFLLDGDGIQKGNWLKAKFDLIGGSTFKIQGILFCEW
ncbi:hypothetical protein MHU86_19050 [Fragilaria crotonensis]|nr:hypothetical protein MHU86_19050 [Fragilaria crotonensis]